MKIFGALFCISYLGVVHTVLAVPSDSRQVRIEGGEFLMGDNYCEEERNNDDWCADETPHRVRLDGFLIDRYEVTNAEYRKCFEARVCGPNELHETRPRDFNQSNQPVVFVTWEDAGNFCRWRKGRLPTEAEWERAANAENLGGAHFGKPYNQGVPREVGSLPPNSYGLFDMMGNVYEWTGDWYGPVATDTLQINPGGPSEGKEKAVRGGAWNSLHIYLRASDRVARSPELRYSDVGFRCVRTLNEKG